MRTILRRAVVLLLLLLGLWGGAQQPAPRARVAQAQSDSPRVYLLTFDGAVTPVLQRYVEQGIETAQLEEAELVILRLDTPGGSVQVTKSIIQVMLASPLPVVVYVAPDGAQAGSAGAFITLAGHAAAMAPSSSIGAASPVDAGGGDIGETMEAKVLNILSADIENLAKRRGEEATAWAIAAVREAAAATADEALALGVVDFIATDTTDLLEQLHGFEVDVRGESRTLQTEGAVLVSLEMNPLQQLLNLIADPGIASILMTLGVIGLIAEIRAPGFGVPGIFGLICLLLALYALGQMEANFAGLLLIGLALALFVAEAFTPTFGLFAVGGLVAFIFGGALLFNGTGFRIPWATIIVTALAVGGFTFFAGAMAIAAQRRPVQTGGEALLGSRARVKEAFAAGEHGSVLIAGEWWRARLREGSVEADEMVEIVDREGYTLVVERQG